MKALSRPYGCWIEKRIVPITYFEAVEELRCSECKGYIRTAIVFGHVPYNYCPYCGVCMKGREK